MPKCRSISRKTPQAGDDSLSSMLKALRTIFRQVGFVGIFMLTLAMAMPAAEAQACAPGDGLSGLSALIEPDDCGSEVCQDCGVVCSQGCCHGPHVAVPAVVWPPLSANLFRVPRSYREVHGARSSAPDGPERPPRT
jgi:hypothetical protein